MAINRTQFFDFYRHRFGRMIPEQVDGLSFLLDKLEQDTRLTIPDRAYLLATAMHETGQRFQPIKEMGTNEFFLRKYDVTSPVIKYAQRAIQMGNTQPGDGLKYIPQGYVPLCWRDHYVKFGQLLDVDLANQPELAMDREIAYAVMATGMLQGLFTGKRLADYIAPESHEGKADYYNARRVLDSMNKARVVASYAKHFELALNLPTRG